MAAKKERPVIQKTVNLYLADPNNTPVEELRQSEEEGPVRSSLVKSILTALEDGDDRIQRLSFERDPTQNNEYAAIFRQKIRLIPDFLLKRVSIQDDLVASIIAARSNHISAFGRPQPDRFSLGFKVEPKPEIIERADERQKEQIAKRAAKFEEKLLNCGKDKGWASEERMSLSRFLAMQVRNALVVGRFATEFLYNLNDQGQEEFHSFRPVDAGTIYKAAPYKTSAEAVRKQAKRLMEQMLNRKLEEQELDNNDEEYPWVQVIDGKPVQVFRSKELYVHNVNPVTDVELQGYPLTPLDTVIAAVTTHINITTHNKLFFQSGRAAKGMLVIQSEDLTEPQVAKIRHQFQANINNVNNSWRMPVFSVGSKDNVQFQQIETSSRDMEFQYLSDMNARVILSAFGMSPEELPGYAHLARGTNNQALAESNKEYQLEAHRDTGIRPLLAQFEDFLNVAVFPVMDEELSEICVIKLVGLDSDSAEKEAVRIGTDAPLHMSYDEVLNKVEKDPIGKEFGGEFPLNPQFQMILDKYLTVGQILEKFFGQKGASQNPDLAYFRDPFWFQMQQMKQQAQQMQMQQEAQAQQAQQAAGQPPPDGGASPEGGEGGPPPEGGGQPEGQPTEKKEEGGDLTTGVDQLMGMLGKSEAQLPPSKRRLLHQQRKAITTIMDGWEADSKKAIGEILDVAEQHAPKKVSNG
jgi:Phage portal protein